ncbi:GNAT family N-acetyltransferase [Kytococcus schroeteri]|uniref:GNAT family N-acetyltransferase n=1 Tax=Kytococcus schroeteri TaxID=138300 RepID=UPI001144D513|nr:GNAT family N-acetyltransferase [Kytococcus schroeteri]
MLPDPLDAAWPRRDGEVTLRPVTLDDVDAMLTYRSRPDVVRYLMHDVLDREAVVARVEDRTCPVVPGDTTVTRGSVVELDGRVVGDVMMRVTRPGVGDDELWVGYALHPDVWGRGLATRVVHLLVALADEMGLVACADTRPGNIGSERVLAKGGLEHVGETAGDGRVRKVWRRPR